MGADTWIKSLNARLLTEPNWTFKAGYLAALTVVAGSFAAYLILTKVLGAVLWFIPIALNAMLKTSLAPSPQSDEDDENALQFGSDGVGYYDNGYRQDDGHLQD